MKMDRNAGLMLLVAALAAPMTQAQEPQEKKPGFFRQLGGSLKDAGQRMVGVTQAGSRRATGPLYTPISGAGKLAGLYQGENHQQAQMGKLEWPRVALTFTEWGASLPCWTVEARIWTSATASTTETFQACADAPLTLTDDLGDTSELNDNARTKGTADLMVGLRVRPGKPNTGEQRTTGPNPPIEPFNVRTSRDGVAEQARKIALSAAWVSGYLRAEDLYPGPSGILTPFRDVRMWIAGFKPDGNRDKN